MYVCIHTYIHIFMNTSKIYTHKHKFLLTHAHAQTHEPETVTKAPLHINSNTTFKLCQKQSQIKNIKNNCNFSLYTYDSSRVLVCFEYVHMCSYIHTYMHTLL